MTYVLMVVMSIYSRDSIMCFEALFWGAQMSNIVTLLNELALYQYKHALFIPGKSPCSESCSVDINVATNDFLLIDVSIIFLHNFKPS